jgi:hypothetical protein
LFGGGAADTEITSMVLVKRWRCFYPGLGRIVRNTLPLLGWLIWCIDVIRVVDKFGNPEKGEDELYANVWLFFGVPPVSS